MAPRMGGSYSPTAQDGITTYISDRASLRNRVNLPRNSYTNSFTMLRPTQPVTKAGWYTVKDLPFSSEGIVKVVRDKVNHRPYVVKTIEKQPDAVLPNEAQALIDLSQRFYHRNVIQLWGVFNNDNKSIIEIAESFCDGGDLRSTLDHFRMSFGVAMPSVVVAHAFAQIASGLAWIHHGIQHCSGHSFNVASNHESIIHGDMKAKNILLRWTRDSLVSGLPDFVIADFGHSVPISEFEDYHGTRPLLPPEVRVNRAREADQERWTADWLAGNGPFVRGQDLELLTAQVDIYTMGLIFAETLTGDFVTDSYSPANLDIPPDHDLPGAFYYTKGCLHNDPELRSRFIDVPIMSHLRTTEMGGESLLSAIVYMMTVRDQLLRKQGRARNEWFAHPLGQYVRQLPFKLPIQQTDPYGNVYTPSPDDESAWQVVGDEYLDNVCYETELY